MKNDMKKTKGDKLVEKLLNNPTNFVEKERGYDLLQEYYDGYSLETLRMLLINQNRTIQCEAVWIASELDEIAKSLITEIIPFIDDEELETRYEALECLAVFTVDEYTNEFVRVVKSLETNCEIIRNLAMRLISLANEEKLEKIANQIVVNNPNNKTHKEGLLFLANNSPTSDMVLDMISGDNQLKRKYGAIAAKKMFNSFPDLLSQCLTSKDMDIKNFAQYEFDGQEILKELKKEDFDIEEIKENLLKKYV